MDVKSNIGVVTMLYAATDMPKYYVPQTSIMFVLSHQLLTVQNERCVGIASRSHAY